jgi:hypothetical protein
LPPSTPSILPSNSSLPPPSLSSSSSPTEPDVSQAQTLLVSILCGPNLKIMSAQLVSFTDGTVRYPLPQALLSEAAPIKPTCFSNAIKISEWRNAM